MATIVALKDRKKRTDTSNFFLLDIATSDTWKCQACRKRCHSKIYKTVRPQEIKALRKIPSDFMIWVIKVYIER